MAPIKNIHLKFACPEKPDKNLYCETCSKQLIDFRNKNKEELHEKIRTSKSLVCGIFNKGQLSPSFLKYAAATALISASLGIQGLAQDSNVINTFVGDIEEEVIEGFPVFINPEIYPSPVNGYEKFYDSLHQKLTTISIPDINTPDDVRVFVSISIDTLGKMKDFQILKSDNENINHRILQILKEMDYPFTPGEQGGKKVEMKIVLPVRFRFN